MSEHTFCNIAGMANQICVFIGKALSSSYF